jgi:hypothetical protein
MAAFFRVAMNRRGREIDRNPDIQRISGDRIEIKQFPLKSAELLAALCVLAKALPLDRVNRWIAARRNFAAREFIWSLKSHRKAINSVGP